MIAITVKDQVVKEKGGIADLLKHLKDKGKLWILVCCAILGFALLTAGSGASKNESVKITQGTSDDKSKYDAVTYSELIEKKIKGLCEDVKGVYNVSVAVTVENGFEYVYAVNRDEKGYEYLVIGSGGQESTVYLTGRPPKISGVGIVCGGGGDPNIKITLIELVSTAFGVSKNNIYVSEAKK